jgi:hypothetical protein
MKLRLLSAALIACALLSISPAGSIENDQQNNSGDTVSRACLTSDTRAVLEGAEAHFAIKFQLVSTCRPGAIIAGTQDKPSWHRYGRAVDLLVPAGIAKSELVTWLYEHARGVVMTYYNMPHIHFDTGTYHKLIQSADAHGHHHSIQMARQQSPTN